MTESPSMPVPLNSREWLDDPSEVVAAITAIRTGEIVIDAQQSTELPAQVAQILLAAKLWADERNIPFRLTGVADDLGSALRMLGLGELAEGAMT